MSYLLNQIKKPNDIKNIPPSKYASLAKEIRHFLIEKVSKTGGHLASNLGTVELTMALHVFLDFPKDKLVWDVGHQAYTHKILTGRKKDFDTLRQYQGMSGFPNIAESDCDILTTGHSSTSVSVADGLVKARELSGNDYKVVAVIGDGALSGGMAYEALNNAGALKSNLIIVLNDNKMSISENVGGMANYLARVRTNKAYTDFKGGLEKTLKMIPGVGKNVVNKLKRSKDSIKHLMLGGMFFEDMGITYIGPINGHDTMQILEALNTASRADKAVLIHVVTQKGRGYNFAEKAPSRFHGVEPFDVKTGTNIRKQENKTYTDIFSRKLTEIAENDKRIVAITAAMPLGTGLEEFRKKYPERFSDVGIAEEHAVTYAAGLAVGGFKPVVAIYSTFLQRSYDQILHDVCINKLPVSLFVDRAGIVGSDGETHQGIFDVSYLSSIPGMTVIAPKNDVEFEKMIEYAINFDGPIAVRYPRGMAYEGVHELQSDIEYGKAEMLIDDKASKVCLFALGSMVNTALEVRELLLKKNLPVSVINARFAAPFDKDMIRNAAAKYDLLVTMEENVASGGMGEHIAGFLTELGKDEKKAGQLIVALPDLFIRHGKSDLLKKDCEIDAEGIADKIYGVMAEN